MARSRLEHATVVAFDGGVGLGVVRTVDGDELAFHAASISDGSRAVALDAQVLVERVAGHAGRLEAGSVTAVHPDGSS